MQFCASKNVDQFASEKPAQFDSILQIVHWFKLKRNVQDSDRGVFFQRHPRRTIRLYFIGPF